MNIIQRGEDIYLLIGAEEHRIESASTLAEQLRVARMRVAEAIDTRVRRERNLVDLDNFRKRHPDAIAVNGRSNALWSPATLTGIEYSRTVTGEQLGRGAFPAVRIHNHGKRIAHLWTGGPTTICGEYLYGAVLSEKPFGRCACAEVKS